MKNYQSWGLIPQSSHQIYPFTWRDQNLFDLHQHQYYLPYGLGRSYGDSCLNHEHSLIPTHHLRNFIHFDKNNGIIRCESGVTFDDLLNVIVPYHWFPPVTPGTKFITIGGAIANDVHGKNHHSAGTFGNHLIQFELLRSDGSRLLCSENSNPDMFQATIGGLGLTGLITWAEFKLKPIIGPFINMETIQFHNYQEFFEISQSSDQKYEYTVSWIDTLAQGDELGRGIFIRGNHSATPCSHLKIPRKKLFSIPYFFPNFALNKYSVKAFNHLYYNRHKPKKQLKTVHYNPFFYPLDAIVQWNKIYGKRGFYQYQCVLSVEYNFQAIHKLLDTIACSGLGSFLVVLKMFGDLPSKGMLSFPQKGVTLALDFANQGIKTLQLFEQLDVIVRQACGRIYPAKDARMTAKDFQNFYPNWKNFKQYIDPKFSSSFWRRVSSQSTN